MKRFWVLAWDQYYPAGGLRNVRSWHDTMEEAEEARQKRIDGGADWTEVVDIENFRPGQFGNPKASDS